MIDELLYAVRDAVRSAGFGYGEAQCDIRDDGQPPNQCGNVYVAVHQGAERSTNDNCLMSYNAFILTLTMRVRVPLSRVGDQLLAVNLAKKTGWNARARQLASFLHMNWALLQVANQMLVDNNPDVFYVNGFAEPCRYRRTEKAVLVGPEWFGAEPGKPDIGLKGDIYFEDARSLQPIAQYI